MDKDFQRKTKILFMKKLGTRSMVCLTVRSCWPTSIVKQFVVFEWGGVRVSRGVAALNEVGIKDLSSS